MAMQANALKPMSVSFPSPKVLLPVHRMDSRLRGNDRPEDQPMHCVAPLEPRPHGPGAPGSAL